MGEWTRPLFEVGHWFERKEEVMRRRENREEEGAREGEGRREGRVEGTKK